METAFVVVVLGISSALILVCFYVGYCFGAARQRQLDQDYVRAATVTSQSLARRIVAMRNQSCQN